MLSNIIINKLKEQIFPREKYEKKVFDSWKRKKIVFLLGPRQTGKTFLIWRIIKILLKKQPPEQFFYFDLESFSDLKIVQDLDYKTLSPYLESLGANPKKPIYLFFDEIQYHPDFSRFLRPITDFNNFKIIVTGSSSVKIKRSFKDSLTGRISKITILPLDFQEFLEFKGKNFEFPKRNPKLANLVFQEVSQLWKEYFLFGGLPKVVLTKSKENKQKELNEIYQTWIQKDIKDFIKIKNIFDFNRLIEVLAVNCGQILNFANLQAELNLSFETLKKYLFLLESSFVIRLLRPFYTNKRQEIISQPKIYWIDLGLARTISKDWRPNHGPFFENAIFLHLIHQSFKDIFYWRRQNKTEVDFVIGSPPNIAIEAKFTTNQKIPSGIISFIKHYKPKQCFTMNTSWFGQKNYKNRSIKFLPPIINLK